MITNPSESDLAIAKPAVFEPQWELSTEWFTDREIVGKSFHRQAGITNRRIAEISEAEMGVKVVEALKHQIDCDLKDCAGLVLASSSLSFPPPEAPDTDSMIEQQGKMDLWPAAEETAHSICDRLGLDLSEDQVFGINWGCSGYTKALELCCSMNASQSLKPGEFYLLVTANRLSERVDFTNTAAAVFGDYATVTPIINVQDPNFESLLHVLYAKAKMIPVDGVGFSYKEVPSVLYPTKDGGETQHEGRIVFEMNGDAVGKHASKFMVAAAQEGLEALSWPNDRVSEWLHHQAGKFITRYFEIFLRDEGIEGEVHDVVAGLGNLSSSSLPQLMASRWEELSGCIGLPSTGAGAAGRKEMSRGIVMLETVTR